MSDNDEQKPNSSRTYSFDDVIRHMRIHHPGCPKKSCLTIAARVSAKDWNGLKLGAAVGIELQTYIRHYWTDYDQLLRSRMMTRDEARAYIAPQVKEILQVWSKPALRLRQRQRQRLVRRQGKV